MAEWRERGYVPDSDDDEDQDVLSSPTAGRVDLPHSLQSTIAQPLQDQSVNRGLPDLEQSENSQGNFLADSEALNRTIPQSAPLISAASPPFGDFISHTFESPGPNEEISERLSLSVADQLHTELQNGLHTVREVLGSHDIAVLRTSPGRSLSSSPLSSVGNLSGLSSPGSIFPLPGDDEAQPAHAPTGVDDFQEFRARRSLRERNPIQVHPYALEDARFQQQWKSRGLRPVRVPEVSIRASDKTTEIDSQGRQTFDSSENESSSQVPSSQEISQSPVAARRSRAVLLQELDAEDLPDLAELIQGDTSYVHQRQSEVRQKAPKPRKTNEAPARFHVYELPGDKLDDHDSAMVDVPPSPPLSGSARSFSSAAGAGTRRAQMSNSTPRGIPTPILSSENNRKRTAVELSNSSNSTRVWEDAGQPSSSEESDSEPPKRKDFSALQRKIKGVLPASWLKLDLKRQTTSDKPLRASSQSPRKSDNKGVAQRVSGKLQRAFSPSPDLLAGMDSSDVEMLEEDRPAAPSRPELRVSSGERVKHRPSIDWLDDVVEDNRIERMIPANRRHHRAKTPSAGRKQQSRIDQGWVETPGHSFAKSYSSPTGGYNPVARSKQSRTKRRQKRPRKEKKDTELNIMDAPGFMQVPSLNRPRFLKVAGRSRAGRTGRENHKTQDPYRKVFKLASMQDTEEVNQTLIDWRAGNISRQPLASHVNGQNMRSSSSVALTTPAALTTLAMPRPLTKQNTVLTQRDENLASLKCSTEATLNSILSPQCHSTILNGQLQPIALPRAPTLSSHRTGGLIHLRNSRRNRSGAGKFEIASAGPRQAQLEFLDPKSLHKNLRIPPLALGQALCTNKAQASGTIINTPSATAAMSSQKDAYTNLPIQRVPRKSRPKRSTVDAGDAPERSNAAPQQEPALHIDLTSSPVDEDEEQMMEEAVISMTHMAQLAPSTAYRQDSFLGKTFLADALALMNKDIPGTQITAEPYDFYEPVTGSRFRWTGFNEDFAIDLKTIFNNLRKQFDLVLSTPIIFTVSTSPDKNTLQARFERCCNCLDAVIVFLNQRPTCEAEGGTACMQTMISLLEDFKKDVVSGSLLTTKPPMALQILNRFTIISYQVLVLSKSLEVTQLQQGHARSSFDAIAQTCFSLSLSEYGLRRLIDMVHQNQNTTSRQPKITSSFPEADTVVILRHLYESLDATSWCTSFNQAMQPAIKALGSRSATRMLLQTTILVCCICPLTLVDANGKVADVLQGRRTYSGWEFVVPAIETCLKDFMSLKDVNTPITRRLGYHVFAWSHGLATRWDWDSPELLVKAMVRSYNANGMRELFRCPERPAGSFPPVVADHYTSQAWDHLSNDDTDFDICLKLVALTLSRKRQTVTEAGEHDKKAADRMRSFVFSLCPNTGELLRGDQELREADLATLINRCSLYIVLYRYAPESCRPRLAQIENLANMSRSHLLVCKVMLETWAQLTEQSLLLDHDAAPLRELAQWIHRIIRQMTAKHSEAREEILQQLNGLSITAHMQGQKVVEANQASINQFLILVFAAWRDCLMKCRAGVQARVLLGGEQLSTIVALWGRSSPMGDEVGIAALQALSGYFSNSVQITGPDVALFQDTLKPFILERLEFEKRQSDEILQQLSMVWFALAQRSVNSRLRSWDEYLEPRGSLSWDYLSDSDTSRHCKILFWAAALAAEVPFYRNDRVRVISFWLSWLVLPLQDLRFEHRLTEAIFNIDGHQPGDLWFKIDVCFRNLSLENLKRDRCKLLCHIIRLLAKAAAVRNLMTEEVATVLRALTNGLKTTWRCLKNDFDAQWDFKWMVYEILTEMESYTVSACPIDPWFLDGKEFPRRPSFEVGIFRTPRLQGSQITTEIADSFKNSCEAAVINGTQMQFTLELRDAFCNADSDMAYDLHMQTRFARDVFAAYVELAFTEPGHLLAIPIFNVMSHTTRFMATRIDGHNKENVVEFVKCSFDLVVAARKCMQGLDPLKLGRFPYLWPVFREISKYVALVVSHYQLWNRSFQSRDIQELEAQMREHARYVYYYCQCAISKFELSTIPEVIALPSSFVNDFDLSLNQKKQSSLGKHVTRSLKVALENHWQEGQQLDTWKVVSGPNTGVVVAIAMQTEEVEWEWVESQATSYMRDVYEFLYGEDPTNVFMELEVDMLRRRFGL